MDNQNQNNIVTILKEIARKEREASKPCSFFVGTVVEKTPLKIKVSQKLTIGQDFCDVCKSAQNVDKGDKVAMIRAQGGQRFLVIDKVV